MSNSLRNEEINRNNFHSNIDEQNFFGTINDVVNRRIDNHKVVFWGRVIGTRIVWFREVGNLIFREGTYLDRIRVSVITN